MDARKICDARTVVPDLWLHRTDAISYWNPVNHKTYLAAGDKKTLKKLMKPNITPAQMMTHFDDNYILVRYMKLKQDTQLDDLVAELDSHSECKREGCQGKNCSMVVGIHPDNFAKCNDSVIRAEVALHQVKEMRKGLKYKMNAFLNHYAECHDWNEELICKVKKSLPKTKQV